MLLINESFALLMPEMPEGKEGQEAPGMFGNWFASLPGQKEVRTDAWKLEEADVSHIKKVVSSAPESGGAGTVQISPSLTADIMWAARTLEVCLVVKAASVDAPVILQSEDRETLYALLMPQKQLESRDHSQHLLRDYLRGL